jgi:GNAT superfamily N-acetyltransferase
MTNIYAASESDAASAIGVIVLAFSADPAARNSWPDPAQYLKHFPNFVRAFGAKAFLHGTADCVDAFGGAALWLPPDVHPDEDSLMEIMNFSAAEESKKDSLALFEQMNRYHPSEPYWYLPLIGVDPSRQGSGLGSALMRHAMIRCDRDQKLAYLESTNPKNIPLYERHGFEVLGKIQVGAAPPIVPMLRKPR